jgi:uncharacterized membrane protein YfcA
MLIARGRRPRESDGWNLVRRTETFSSARLSVILLSTGFLGIGYEVLVIRMLSQVLEDTVYSFASALTVYLFGTACGATLYQRFRPNNRFREVLDFLLVALASLCLLGTFLLWNSNDIYRVVREGLGAGTAGAGAVGAFGASPAGGDPPGRNDPGVTPPAGAGAAGVVTSWEVDGDAGKSSSVWPSGSTHTPWT